MDESKMLENAPTGQETSVQQSAVVPAPAEENVNFSGSHDHSIDTKGRMIIPTSFRDGLGARFVCALSTDNKAIALYPMAAWNAEVNEIRELMKKNREAEKLLIRMNKFAYTDCEMDSQGRILLPAKLRQKILDTEREVNISGAGAYVRVMTQAASDLEDEAFEREFPDPLAFIASIQQGKN